MSIDLETRHLECVRRILRDHVPECEVWAYGSRVRGTSKPFSDLDLAVVSPHPLPPRRLALLLDAFVESDLPIKVDVVDWATAGTDFRRRIAERHEVVSQAGEIGFEPANTSQ